MRTLTLTAAALLVATVAHADGARTLAFAEHGFVIEPPAGHADTQLQQVVAMYLPQSDGFAPNVNVQVQPFAGTMDQFVAVSLDQFKAAGLTLLAQKHDAKSATVEYTGTMQGRALHWYSRAFRGKRGIILATATAAESQWAKAAAALRRSVDSLRLTP